MNKDLLISRLKLDWWLLSNVWKSFSQSRVWPYSRPCFNEWEVLPLLFWSLIVSTMRLFVSPTWSSLNSSLEHLPWQTTFCLCWKSILSFAGNLVDTFILLWLIVVLMSSGKVIFNWFLIFDSNWCLCFPEYETNGCISCYVS